jgi:outer membrane biosynthesis protein TonB
MTKLTARWEFPLKIDRRYLTGIGLLVASLLVAVVVLFHSSSESKLPTDPLTEADITGKQTPVIESGTTAYRETLAQEPPPSTPAVITRVLPINEPAKPPVTLPENLEPSEKKKAPEKKKEPVKAKESEKAKTQEQPPAEPSPVDSAKMVAKIQPQETPPETGRKETGRPEPPAAKLNKQVVISRGTPVDVVLDRSYDYDSATDKTQVTLSVTEAVVISGVTVIPVGAKAYALLHKSARWRELELEMLEVESITGQKLKTLHSTSKSVSFPQGKRFKIHLEYNRLGR